MNQRKIAIVAGVFHRALAEEMITAATAELAAQGVTVDPVVRVPGSYEVPLAVDRLLAKKTIQGVVVLGYIERGETHHGEVMGQVVQKTLVELELKHHKPVGMGIIGPDATAEQAHVRKITAAQGAARAAVAMLDTLTNL